MLGKLVLGWWMDSVVLDVGLLVLYGPDVRPGRARVEEVARVRRVCKGWDAACRVFLYLIMDVIIGMYPSTLRQKT